MGACNGRSRQIKKENRFMKNAKKLLILLLSLVLLIGVFAVLTMADEDAVLTVEYPDGTVQTYKSGETVAAYAVPSEFVTMVDGKGYKFTTAAGAAWTYSEPLPATVTADDLGKTITATVEGEQGTEQVYATVKLVLSNVDYYKWYTGESSSTCKFVKAGDSYTLNDVTYETVKRDAGTYMLYFTDPAKLGKFFTTSEKTEINGKMLDYQDFRTGGSTGTRINVKLYADHTFGSAFCWGKNGYDRPNTSNVSGQTAQSSGGTTPVSFDMNGYNVTVTSTSRLELRAMPLTLYSSKPGAHWYHLDSTAAFYVSDDGVLYIGNNSSNNNTYSDNLYVHCQTLFQGHYGSGAYIIGGHYYQTATPSQGFVLVSRRIEVIQNAKFYVLPGQSVFYDGSARDSGSITKGTSIITNCEFYCTDRIAIVYGKKTISYNTDGSVKSTTTPSAILRFSDCTFYGAALAMAGDANTAVYAKSADGKTTYTNTFKDPITYQTVTWPDGSTTSYYAGTLEAAKAFAETCARVESKDAVDGTYEKTVGTAMYLVSGTANYTFTYDDAFNAKCEDLTEGGQKVYFSVYPQSGAPIYYVDGTGTDSDTMKYMANATAANKAFHNLLASLPAYNATIVMYADLTVGPDSGNFMIIGKNTYQLDLNGNTLKSTADNIGLDVTAYKLYLYSSRPGGVVDTKTAKYFARSNDYSGTYGNFYVGEDNGNSATDYTKNLTVYCKSVNCDLYGGSMSILGGTFVQTAKYESWFALTTRNGQTGNSHMQSMSNATFVVTQAGTSFLNHPLTSANRTYTNCNFINASGSATSLFYALKGNVCTFSNCGFYNVDPVETAFDYTVKYSGTQYCAYTTDAPVKEGKVLARTSGRTIVADGVTYEIDGVYTDESQTVTVHFGEGLTELWTINTTITCKPAHLDSLKHYVTQDDGTTDYLYDAYANPAQLLYLQKHHIGTEITVDIFFGKTDEDVAFAYRDLATDALVNVCYADCGETDLGVGEKFHALFYSPEAGYEITMFRDMRLTKSVPFGPYVKEHDTSNRDYFNTLANGSIIWDLNGTTVTIDKNVTGLVKLNAANANYKDGNETWTGDTVFGFEGYNYTNTFTLKSSIEGGKIVNESSAHLFGIGEGKRTKIVILGENLTIDAGSGYVINNKEINRDNSNKGNRLEIDGGTFIGGNDYVLRLSMSSSVKNATIISTNASPYALIAVDGYRTGTTVLTNNIFVGAQAGGTDLIRLQNSNGKQNIQIDGCTFYNVKATKETASLTPVTYTGNCIAASEADLAVMYASAPAGTVRAYNTVTFNDVTYVTVAYYTDASYVTLQNVNYGTTQNWIVGSVFTPDEITNGITKTVDGVYYYASEAVWGAMVGNESVALDALTSAENAGKIIVIEAMGDYVQVYFTVTVNGATTYYTADTYAKDFQTVLTNPTNSKTYEIKLYSNIETVNENGVQQIGKANASGVYYKIDLNGYTWRFDKTADARGQYAIIVSSVYSYIYSTVSGGTLDTVSAAQGIICVDKSGHAFFGEPSTTSTAYGENFTVYCDAIAASEIWSTEVQILGGTYIKTSDAQTNCFVDTRRTPPILKNATFIMKNVRFFARGMRLGTMENCTVISETEMQLFTPLGLPGFVASTDANGNKSYNVDIATTFKGCNFYNVIPNTCEEIDITYENCNFNKSYTIPQAGGYIAYTGAPVTLNINGVDYVFGAAFLAEDQVALVNWGFGITEYWKLGETATHENAIVDGLFGYTFGSLTVAESENTATATLVAIHPNAMQMSLTLQSQIGMNLMLNPAALEKATVTLNGETYVLANLEKVNGIYVLKTAIKPNKANQPIPLVIELNGNTHTIPVSVGTYAEALLASNSAEKVKNLTYSMIEYVRAMTKDETFCNVEIPDSYRRLLTAEEYVKAEGNAILTGIRFSLAETIAIEVAAAAATEEEVNLVLAKGRSERANLKPTILDEETVYTAIFEGLYVNEFFGDITILVGGETYTYNLANYYHAMQDSDEKAVIEALYNYAYHAQEYVDSITPAAN